VECVTAVLIRFDLKYKVKPESLQIKVGGYDRRKEKFIGSIQMEHFAWEGGEGSRCVMNRQTVSTFLLYNHHFPGLIGMQGNPMEWRRLWKEIATSPEVHPHVLRREI
jgi:serine/threonine-protein kinase Chk1